MSCKPKNNLLQLRKETTMKKKNIIKKLLSVVLSAATVFSLLTLPAQAIVPGEDAYGQTYTLMRYDVASGISVPVEIPDYNIAEYDEGIGDADNMNYARRINAEILNAIAAQRIEAGN